MTTNNEIMNEQNEEDELPKRKFETTDVGASIESQGMLWDGVAGGRLNVDHFSGDVSFWLSQDDGDSLVSVSVYFSPETAREIASSVRTQEHIKWHTEICTIWVNRGLLYTEGPSRHDDGQQATVTLGFSDGKYRMGIEYIGQDDDDVVSVETKLGDDVRMEFAESLDYMADVAEDYEPPETVPATEKDSSDTSTSRLANVLPIAITGVVTVGATYFVMGELESQMTINGQAVTGPSPGQLGVLMFLVMFIAFAIQYAPGMVSDRV